MLLESNAYRDAVKAQLEKEGFTDFRLSSTGASNFFAQKGDKFYEVRVKYSKEARTLSKYETFHALANLNPMAKHIFVTNCPGLAKDTEEGLLAKGVTFILGGKAGEPLNFKRNVIIKYDAPHFLKI